jgi:hypothetical protein
MSQFLYGSPSVVLRRWPGTAGEAWDSAETPTAIGSNLRDAGTQSLEDVGAEEEQEGETCARESRIDEEVAGILRFGASGAQI